MSPAVTFGYLQPSQGAADKPPAADAPFRIAVLGDFSGRASRGEIEGPEQLTKRKAYRIDRDNFDEVMGRLRLSLRLSLPDDSDEISLTFASLDDFHPDEISRQVDRFDDLDGSEEKTALMNAVLHHPHAQALEAAWRGLDWLLRRALKKDSPVEVVLYDLTLEELTADLTAADDLASSAVYQLLVEQAMEGPKGAPWALWIGDYTFDVTAANADLLGRMARIASRARAPFLAGAHRQLLKIGFKPDDEAAGVWDSLRQLPESAHLGLALPRFLLRQPYGEATKAIDRFMYEEQSNPPQPDGYLWGNAALACAALLGQSFHKDAWAMKPGSVLDLAGMPLHTYSVDGDQEVTLAEAWLERREVERLVKLGLMPLLCIKGKDAVQLYRFLSLAQPTKGQPASDLAGRWGQKGAARPQRSARDPMSMSVGLAGGAAPPAAAPDGQEIAEAEVFPNAVVEPGEEPAEAAPAEAAAPAAEEMDPELAALLAQMEAPAAAAPPAEAAPAAEEMDPELAALLAQMETPAEPAPAAAAAAEEMDPELAALLAQMDQGAAPAAEPATDAAPEPPADEMDPELAALLAQMEAPAEPAPAAESQPPESPPAEEVDPELAALLAQMEGGDQPLTEPAVAEPAPADVAAEEMDPELAALLAQMGDVGAGPAPTEASAEVEALGGRQALEDLGWPTFVPAFAEDIPRQVHILQDGLKNRAVQREVQDLVKKCGGYSALAAEGVTPEQGLNQQLRALRQIKASRDRKRLRNDPEGPAMAKHYGANLASAASDEARLDLLQEIKNYDRWAADARNFDAAVALQSVSFTDKRQASLELQRQALGGEELYRDWVAENAADAVDGPTLEQQVALLKALKEYNKLGGEAAYRAKAAGADPQPEPLARKLEQLKAILSAEE